MTQLECKDLARHVQQLIDVKLMTCSAATGNILQLATSAEVSCETDSSLPNVQFVAGYFFRSMALTRKTKLKPN